MMKTGGIVLALALAAGAEEVAFTWPASGTATIPAGATVTVTDADRAAMDACSTIAFADATGKLVLNTAQGPKSGVAITGAGTIVKKGTGGWRLETVLAFTGTWDFEAGVVTNAAVGSLGSVASGAGPVIVRSGAALVTTVQDFFKHRCLRLAGAGPDGRGAWVCAAPDTSGLLSWLALDADATMRIDADYVFFQNNGKAACFDLNGHTLTKIGKGTPYFINGTSVNGGRYVVAEKTSSPRGVFAWDPAAEIVLTNKANWMIYNDTVNLKAQLTVTDTNLVYHAHQFRKGHVNAVNCPQDESKNFITGPVVLTNATSLLKIGLENALGLGENMGVTGPVSGPGSIYVFPESYYFGRVTFGCPSNTFTGTFTVGPAANEDVRCDLIHSNAIPNYAQAMIWDGWLRVRPGATGWDWCADSIARFGAQADFYQSGAFVVNTEACADNRFTLSGAAIDAAAAARARGQARYGHEGAGDLTIAGPVATAVRYGAYSGAVRFTGTGPINVLGGGSGEGAIHTATGYVEIADCTYAQFTNFPVYVGPAYGASELRIVNSTVGGAPTNLVGTASANAHVVGIRGFPGVLRISGTSVVTAKVDVAESTSVAQGAVYQSGGEMNFMGMPTDSDGSTTFANSGSGYYELTGGTGRLLGYGSLAAWGRGVLAQYGGTFVVTNHPSYVKKDINSFWDMPRGGNGFAHHYVRSGTTEIRGNILLGRNGRGVVSVDGPDALFVASKGFSFGYASGTIATVNLCRGGTVSGYVGARHVKSGAVDGFVELGWKPCFYVNANGGRWKSTSASSLGTPWDECANKAYPGVTRVTVFPAGLIYDVKQYSLDTLRQPLLAPTGKGISSIPWTTRGGYIGSPYVEITGDGAGAEAFAEFDSSTGEVTGIRVLSPGWDYTWAKAKILGGMGNPRTGSATNCWLTIDCVLADNAATGGLTKEGDGTLEIASTNTFTGTTLVKAGTVKLNAADRLHAASALELAGGTFDANHFAQTFRAIGGASGTLANAENVTATMASPVNSTTAALNLGALADGISVTGAWSIDLADVIAGHHPVYAADLAFGAASTLTIANLALVDQEVGRYDLIETTAGHAITGLPTLTNTLPTGWSLVQSGNRISLRFPRGLAVIIR